MGRHLELASGRPLGFPHCPRCAYLRHGLPGTCLECVEEAVDRPEGDGNCPLCGRSPAGEACRNELCSDEGRRIARIRAIVHGSSTMGGTISRYRHDGRSDWSLIFGRLVLAWLDQHARLDPPDVIVANPTFVADESTPGHTERVLDAAAKEDALGEWPIDTGVPRLLVRIASTKRSTATGPRAKRVARERLHDALEITKPSAFTGRRVLLYDHEAVTGTELDAVAAFLQDEGGARSVEALVLVASPSRH